MKNLSKFALPLCALGAFTGCKSTPEQPRDQTVRLATNQKLSSCDPRKAQGLAEANIARMLFEGLTYIDENGKIFPGIATKIQISQDLKTYSFHLRDAFWSNGDPVRAADFEESWKSMLDPKSNSPMAYMLFPIWGAQGYHEGRNSRDDVRIMAMDDKTLVVQLAAPSPYFLQLTATASYFPVPEKWDETNPVGNGPFMLKSFEPQKKLELVKNPHYWGNATVTIEKAEVMMMDDNDALQAFKDDKIDWIGSPLSILTQADREKLENVEYAPAAGVEFLRLNTLKAPFISAKVRKAFMLATDTKAICDTILKGGQLPATGLVPPGMGIHAKDVAFDLKQAAKLFEEGLLDIGVNRADIPSITLSYVAAGRMQKIAEQLAENWKKAFAIEVILKAEELEPFYNQLFSQNYEIAAGSWFADYYDPMSFLSIFQTADNGVNYTGWKNPDYTQLLASSNMEIDPTKRMGYLQQAQDVLMTDLPILPLFYFTFSYSKNSALNAKKISPMGTIDIENAKFGLKD